MLLLLLSCTADSPKMVEESPSLLGPFLEGDCDPLVPELCGLPFPSNVYLRPDADSPTGARVNFGATTLPRSDSGTQSSPDLLNVSDGFSPAAGPITFLPGATATGFAGPDNIALSLTADSPTVILDATTGERVAHFVELDLSHDDDSRRAILFRPVKLLEAGHRYIVALHNVVDTAGAPVAASEAFAALRDGTASTADGVEARRPLYDDIFAKLETAGVDRSGLQLAWDFTVASRQNATDRLLYMRDTSLASLSSGGATYTITSVQEKPNEWLALRIEGTVTVPLFLDDAGPGGIMQLDADGVPVQNGTAEQPFLLIVAESCRGKTCPIIQYGHGLFGSRYSLDSDDYYRTANDFGAVVLSMDWTGMSRDDVAVIAAAAASGDLNRFASIPDRSEQGMVSLAVALRTLMGDLAKDPALALDGASPVDTGTRYYVGGSQGGIYGATYMAITPDIERGLLVVPGASYSLMLPRSVYWEDYATPFVVDSFEDPRNVQLVLGYVQMLWDRAEPSGYASAISTDPLPNTPSHRVVLLEGIGDHQVPNLSTELLARSIDAAYLAPGNQQLWGLDPVEGPITDGNVMLDYSYGLPPNPTENVPMEEGADPHSSVYFEPSAQMLMGAFLTTGTVENPCDGPCDPN